MRRAASLLTVATVVTMAFISLASPANAVMWTRALWDMNSLPTMVDSAGGDNNGTTRNVSQWGGSYGFDGRSSVATAPDAPNLDPGTTPIRVAARFALARVPDPGDTFDVIRKGYAPTAGGMYKLEIRNVGGRAVAACRFEDSGTGYGDVTGTVNLANGGWVEIRCYKDSTGVTLTGAGETRKVSRSVGSIANAAPVYIGAKGDGTDWFPGLIDAAWIDNG